MKVLDPLAKLCAILAGLLLTVITLVTCASMLGRNTIEITLVGDIELTAFAGGAAVALFMPWCQLRRGNIIVDFFTARVSQRGINGLDRLGALLMAMMFALLAWRGLLGGINAYDTHSTSMMLGMPEWVLYSAMIPPFVLTALIALHQAVFGFSVGNEDHLSAGEERA